jgi:hypothetical protein
MINFNWEYESRRDFLFLQADQEEQYQRLKQEINEEENRLPARITVLKEEKHEPESNTLALRRID